MSDSSSPKVAHGHTAETFALVSLSGISEIDTEYEPGEKDMVSVYLLNLILIGLAVILIGQRYDEVSPE